MKIIRTWSELERWSAYDTDEFYYVEVEHDEIKYVFKSMTEWDLDSIKKEVSKQINKNQENFVEELTYYQELLNNSNEKECIKFVWDQIDEEVI